MKIYVYAISKNEQKFAKRWALSMSEADGVFVLDTGSEDKTVEILAENGVFVEQCIFTPWRFDTARNRSLDLVPSDADLCVCTDLDEVFSDGWRDRIEACVRDSNANLFSCHYVWSHDGDGKEGVTFAIKKIHTRHGFSWKGIVHEVLVPDENTTLTEAHISGIKLVHLPDLGKSRGQYLPLLEQAVAEQPQNDRNSFYLGREYYFHAMYDKAERELMRHLSLPSATWKEERSASLRYLAKAQIMLGKQQSAVCNLIAAVSEYPHSREPWIELGEMLYFLDDWFGAIWAMRRALAITRPSSSYLNEPRSFSAFPHDVLSIAFYRIGIIENAFQSAKSALALAPDDARIRRNCDFFSALLENNALHN